MAYHLRYSDYITPAGPPDPARWIGPPGPMGPPGIDGEDGIDGAPGVDSNSIINVLDHGARGDGVTNDNTAIQNVLNTYAGKAIVFIPDTGTPFMVSGLRPPTGTSLLINGTVKLLPNSPAGVVELISVNSVVISGFGKIDGNRAAQVTHPGGMSGLFIHQSSNIQISGITIIDAWNWNLNVTETHDLEVEGVSLIGGGAANEFAGNSYNCWLTNCEIDGTNLEDYAFCFYGGVHDSGAIGNTIRNAGVGTALAPPGIGILSDNATSGLTTQPCHDIVIEGNVIHGGMAAGISCTNVSGGAQSGIIISNNRCYDNCKNPTIPIAVGDCWIDHTNGVTITGNQFSGNGSAAAAVTGVFIGPNVTGASITNNHIFNVGQGRTDGSGIWIASSTATQIMISGNFIYDNQTTATMHYSVIGTLGVESAIIGNHVDRGMNIGLQSDTVSANAVAGVWTVGLQNTNFDFRTVISGRAGHRSVTQYQATGLPRWDIGLDGAAEGSGSGSNLAIASYDDSSVLQPPAIIVRRADNGVLIPTRLNINAPVALLNAAVPAVGRWFLGCSPGGETGGDTGSDFGILSCTDAGSPKLNALSINRATGKTTMTKLNLSNLPTSATGLVAGDVWRNGAVLNIV